MLLRRWQQDAIGCHSGVEDHEAKVLYEISFWVVIDDALVDKLRTFPERGWLIPHSVAG